MEFLIITGPPYSGKGTQCELIEKHLGYLHISTGDLCRAEKDKNTSLGKTVNEYNVKGDLVPDDIMKQLLSAFIDDSNQNKSIILDGYPRTKKQVHDLEDILLDKKVKIQAIINIDVPNKVLLERAKNRAKTSDREDDRDSKIHLKRINIFEEETLPAINYMRTKFKVDTFDGLGSIEDISQKIMDTLK